jgi:hypothetical protein
MATIPQEKRKRRGIESNRFLLPSVTRRPWCGPCRSQVDWPWQGRLVGPVLG